MKYALQPDELALGLTIVIAAFTVPSVQKLIKAKDWRVKNPNHDDAVYEDEDGVATRESMSQFSNKTQFIIIFTAILAGVAISVADAVFTAVEERFIFNQPELPLLGLWLLVPAWVSDRADG
jgi:hypothetical protein